MKPTPPPLPTLRHELDDELAWLKRVCLWLAMTASALVLPVFLSTDNHRETISTIAFAAMGWLAYFLARKGRIDTVRYVLVIGAFVVTIASVVAYGSVRTGSNFLFVGIVVGASLFLSKFGIRVVVLLEIAALGLLNWAEYAGMMPQANFQVGLKTWATQTACLVVVALLVFHGRNRSERINQRLREELSLRRMTEQERDRNLERFARIFRASPTPMIAQSAITGSILDVNQAFERCYGYARVQALGRTDSFLWADNSERKDYLRELYSTRRAEPRSVRGLRADGSEFNAQISSELGDDPDDQLVITTITDMTENDKAVDKLRRSEERFAKAFNFSPLNMAITRLSDGAYIEVNESENSIIGMRTEELAGKTSTDVGVWLTTEDRQVFIDRLLAEGKISAYDTVMRHKDGPLVQTRVWAELVDIDGEQCILSCTVNVTEEKRREALLIELAKGLSGSTGEAFFSALSKHMAAALEADIVTVTEREDNGQLRQLAVWSSDKPIDCCAYDTAGTPCDSVMQSDGVCIFPRNLGQLFPTQPVIQETGMQAFAGQALRDPDGNIIGLVNAMWREAIDPTPESKALIAIFASRSTAEMLRLRREREIRHLNESLERRVTDRTAELVKLNAELDSFAYSVSHDLKSPLRSIEGFTQLLSEQLDGRLSEEEAALFTRVLGATHRMSNLISDLLALARVSQGEMIREEVNISALAHEITEAESRKHDARQINWRIEPGMRCNCDSRLARIALSNLLENAAKYTRDCDSANVVIGTVHPAANEDNTVQGASGAPVFFIEDNGAGFDMRYAEKLFKPFQRLHMPSSGFEGTGIGLATVRRIVERHAGFITGRAEPERGARFEFSFGEAAEPEATVSHEGGHP
ncbi:hypothetical protein NBRC116584_34530 [Hydrogenophaga sp. 5NK40-0174]